MKTALYRHFDSGGALLYVGISLNSIQRTMQHRCGAHWFHQIARITIDWRETRSEALAAEAIAIARENPRFNIVRPGWPAVKPERWTEGIQHVRSQLVDGWYGDGSGEHMLGWWRAFFPGERFQLLRYKSAPYGLCDLYLDWGDWERWSQSPPSHQAADEYDRRAA